MIGRILVGSDGAVQMIGYYPFIEALPSPLFSGTPGETTAFFTFRSTPFTVTMINNATITHLFAVPSSSTGNLLNLYFNAQPNQDFNNPDTFSSGQLVATYKTRAGMLTGVAPYVGTDIVTMDLVSSNNFSFQGKSFNFATLGTGTVTIYITAAASPSSAQGTSPVVWPFGATAVVANGFGSGQ
jgi:hypothetical protein